jgi:hypothetical protein
VGQKSKALDGSIVMTTTGDHSQADSSNGSTRLRRIWFDMLDNITCELSIRFGSVNDSLSAAATALLPGSDTFLSEINLLPLTQLIQQVQQFDVSLFPVPALGYGELCDRTGPPNLGGRKIY